VLVARIKCFNQKGLISSFKLLYTMLQNCFDLKRDLKGRSKTAVSSYKLNWRNLLTSFLLDWKLKC
jgi:hypothetical protein